jgi:hypothetical protein
MTKTLLQLGKIWILLSLFYNVKILGHKFWTHYNPAQLKLSWLKQKKVSRVQEFTLKHKQTEHACSRTQFWQNCSLSTPNHRKPKPQFMQLPAPYQTIKVTSLSILLSYSQISNFKFFTLLIWFHISLSLSLFGI